MQHSFLGKVKGPYSPAGKRTLSLSATVKRMRTERPSSERQSGRGTDLRTLAFRPTDLRTRVLGCRCLLSLHRDRGANVCRLARRRGKRQGGPFPLWPSNMHSSFLGCAKRRAPRAGRCDTGLFSPQSGRAPRLCYFNSWFGGFLLSTPPNPVPKGVIVKWGAGASGTLDPQGPLVQQPID